MLAIGDNPEGHLEQHEKVPIDNILISRYGFYIWILYF